MKAVDAQLFDLWTQGRVPHPKAAVLAVNALCFHDPGEDSGRGHLGTRPANINCFTQDDDARRHLRTLCTGVHNAMKTCTNDLLEILVFCRHCRRACKRALTTNYRVEGAPRLEHLSRQAWEHTLDRSSGWALEASTVS